MNSDKGQNVKTDQDLKTISQDSLWKEIEELSQLSEYSSSQVSPNVSSPFDSSSFSLIGHDEPNTSSLDLIVFSPEEQELLNSLDQATVQEQDELLSSLEQEDFGCDSDIEPCPTTTLRVETDIDSEEVITKTLEFIAPNPNLPRDRMNGLRERSKRNSHKKKPEGQKLSNTLDEVTMQDKELSLSCLKQEFESDKEPCPNTALKAKTDSVSPKDVIKTRGTVAPRPNSPRERKKSWESKGLRERSKRSLRLHKKKMGQQKLFASEDEDEPTVQEQEESLRSLKQENCNGNSGIETLPTTAMRAAFEKGVREGRKRNLKLDNEKQELLNSLDKAIVQEQDESLSIIKKEDKGDVIPCPSAAWAIKTESVTSESPDLPLDRKEDLNQSSKGNLELEKKKTEDQKLLNGLDEPTVQGKDKSMSNLKQKDKGDVTSCPNAAWTAKTEFVAPELANLPSDRKEDLKESSKGRLQLEKNKAEDQKVLNGLDEATVHGKDESFSSSKQEDNSTTLPSPNTALTAKTEFVASKLEKSPSDREEHLNESSQRNLESYKEHINSWLGFRNSALKLFSKTRLKKIKAKVRDLQECPNKLRYTQPLF